MLRWICKLIYFNSAVAGKTVFFDTNCYRGIARRLNKSEIDALLKNVKAREKRRCISSGLSYLVLSEMLAHLGDQQDSQSYLESKYGLYTAVNHVGLDRNRVMPNSDSELHRFILGHLPTGEKIRERSLVELVFHIIETSFDDNQIRLRIPQYQKTKEHLQTMKDSWLDSIVDHFIKKHEPTFVGGWQLFISNPGKRTKLLNELIKAENSGNIFLEFAAGVCLYISNSFNEPIIIDSALLDRVANRFKPIFQLQLYIMKKICQGGYNLQKRQNDVTDFLILTSFNPENSIFVSNESNQLVPRLQSLGYSKKVLTLNEYLRAIGIKDTI